MAAHAGHVAVFLAVAAVLLHHLGIQAPREHGAVLRARLELLHCPARRVKVHRLKQRTRTAGDRLLALEHQLLQLGRETALGLAHHALEVGHHRIREGQRLALFEDVFGR